MQKEIDVDFATMPDSVKNTLNEKFSSYQHSDSVEQLTLANGQQQYLVDLTQGKKSLEAILDLTGSVICSG